MKTLIQQLTLLSGREFRKIDNGNLLIEDGIIQRIGLERPNTSNDTTTLNGKGLLAIPGFINAHIHIGDSFAKDVGVGKTQRELVHPLYGIKTQLLKKQSPEIVRESISQTSLDMLASGITTFVDFREGGSHGIQLAREALSECKQRVLLLCRPDMVYQEDVVVSDTDLPQAIIEDSKKALAMSDGFGISGANEYTNKALRQIAQLTSENHKLIAIHAAESPDAVHFSNNAFHTSEIARILRYMKPNMLVHMTHSTPADIRELAENHIGIICCPRANATLGVGFPPISKFLQEGVRVALGTDNVMLNSPDMFRELDYTARMVKATSHDPSAITSAEVLRMANVNAADILGMSSTIGSLEVGKKADIVFLDMTAHNLTFSQDLVSSVVHRARPDNISCVMIQGEIAYGRFPN